MHWLLTSLRRFWRGVVLSVLLGTLTIASSVGLMMTSAWLISKCALQPSIADLGVSIVAVRAFGIARAVFRYLERLVSHDTTFRMLAKLRVEFYRAIEPLAPAKLSKFKTGDLLARVVADVESLQDFYLRAVAPPVVELVTIVGLVTLFAAFDWLIALTLLLFVMMTGVALPLMTERYSRALGRELVAIRAELNTALVDNIQGLAEILAYGITTEQDRQRDELSNALASCQRRFNLIESISAGAMTLLVNSGALAVLASAMLRMDSIYLVALTLGVFAGFEALMPLSQVARQWDTSLSAAQRLAELAEAAPAVCDPMQPVARPAAGDIALSGVSFRYSLESDLVFDGLDLTLKQGEKIAILGSSGSGKSTLVHLLVRFWDYQSGSIRLGGIELKDMAQADVRQTIAVMAQQTYLFNTTILENIRIAQPSATDEQIVVAAQKARIHDFVAALPHGYETITGENGAAFSGGERRRIALARVLLKNAPILILDEPTAYLDTDTERAILKVIFDTLAGQSLILLTHRRTLLEHVDRVYALQHQRLRQVR